MSNPNYTLEIVSHHPQFNNKALRKYYVDGIETVGAWGDEPFEIRFKNNTYQKVQVKLSMDGTNILTGKLADTEVSSDMWVVNAYGTLSLTAWPETNQGGAAFVFTSADKSVALHTHGDLSHRGIIAAAVFVEGHVPEPIKVTPPTRVEEHHHHHYDYYPYPYYPIITPWWNNPNQPVWIYNTSDNTGNLGGITYQNNAMPCGSSVGSGTFGSSDMSMDCLYSADVSEVPAAAGLESLVSIGAGEHVDQKITYVAGLIKPVFTETVRVKYIWWDTLVEKLQTQTHAEAQPSGFPGDAKQKNIDLKGTPRVGQKAVRQAVQQPVFDRF